jgi:hypothetical protein
MRNNAQNAKMPNIRYKGHLMPFLMPLSFKFQVPAHHTGYLIPTPMD